MGTCQAFALGEPKGAVVLALHLIMRYPRLNLQRGVLISSNFLQSHTFLICFSFVAFNTLIYLGLTLAKLLPRTKPRFLKQPKDSNRLRTGKFF